MTIHIDGTDKAVAARPGLNVHLLNASQISCMTRFTRDGNLDMSNKKPYRTKANKKLAQKDAVKAHNGAFYSVVPRNYHKKANG